MRIVQYMETASLVIGRSQHGYAISREREAELRAEWTARTPAFPAKHSTGGPTARHRRGLTVGFLPPKRAKRTTVLVRRIKEEVGACEVCGWRDPRGNSAVLHGHHVVPIACGGPHTAENLAVLCPNHHAVAHRTGHQTRTGLWVGPQTKEALLVAIRLEEQEGARRERTRGLVESLRGVC